jgi:hypothetical protein
MVKRHKKHMLRASTQGKVAIKAAQEHKKWVWDIKSNREPLVLASLAINPDWNLEEHPQYDPVWADGINEASWKRFLIGKEPIPAIVFQAYCQILELGACKEITSCILRRLLTGMKDVIPLWTNPAVGQIHSCHLSI